MYTYKVDPLGKLRVVDGDTVKVRLDLGFSLFHDVTLRFARIDCPEKKEPEKWTEARLYVVNALTQAKQIVIETYKHDSFGRYLAEVFYVLEDGDQRNLNDELLEYGLATLYKRGKPNDKSDN